MSNRRLASPVVAAATLLLSGGPAAGQDLADLQYALPTTEYRVKPSEVVVPDDVPIGAYARITQPFENWTLICDENLIRKQKICNISQTIVNRAGENAFSWSLAATETGQPMMILRIPAVAGPDSTIRIELPGSPQAVTAETSGCNTSVCVAMANVGPLLREHIERGSLARISYSLDGQDVRISAPLEGLSAALAAIS